MRVSTLAVFVALATNCSLALSFTRDGQEFQVNTFTYGSQGSPAAAGNDSAFLVVWFGRQATSDNRIHIRAQRYTAVGTRWGSEFSVNTIPPLDVSDEFY